MLEKHKMESKTDKDRFAIYHMSNNSYLGDCLCLVYRPIDEEITEDHLLSDHVFLVIKSKSDLKKLQTITDIEKSNIFINDQPVLLRISSECFFGSFGDSHCDCELQRILSLREIQKYGEGVFISLPQEAQGNGLFYKATELELQVNGFLPSGEFIGQKSITEAAEILLNSSESLDKRKYTSVKTIFHALGFAKYDFSLMSENPSKRDYLESKLGIKIHSLHKIKGFITIENIGEHLSKLYSKNFVLSDDELKEIYTVISSSNEVPERAASVLRFIREDIELGKHFNANTELLKNLVGLLDTKNKSQSIQDLDLFQDSKAYKEYHTELRITAEDLDKLFKSGILISDELLRYEENYFYDLPYFSSIPSRTLKIRKAFRLNDIKHPISSELIYKIPTEEKNHIIKCIKIDQEDIINLIDISLRDYNVHVLPVFTHVVTNRHKDIKTLIKRYSKGLRVLSLMGEESWVKSLVSDISKVFQTSEIDSLSDQGHADKETPTDFDWERLASEETHIYKKYFKG